MTRTFDFNLRGLITSLGLGLVVAVSGCGAPGTNVAEEKKKDQAAFTSYSDVNLITDPAEKTAAQALVKAGGQIFIKDGSVSEIMFQKGGLDDTNAAHLAKTPNVVSLGFPGCTGVTDKSVPHIVAMKNLERAQLMNTGITAAGVKKLMAAHPKANIMHPASMGAMRKMQGGAESKTDSAQGGGRGGPPGGGPPRGGRPGQR